MLPISSSMLMSSDLSIVNSTAGCVSSMDFSSALLLCVTVGRSISSACAKGVMVRNENATKLKINFVFFMVIIIFSHGLGMKEIKYVYIVPLIGR